MYVIEQASGKKIEVEIVKATDADLPLIKDKWNFNWKKEFKKDDVEIYVLRQLDKTESNIEAIMSLKLIKQDGKKHEHIKMDLLEVAPHNYRSNGQFSRAAGCLIAFGCEMSFTVDNNYKGWLMFEAKTEIIDLYKNKYGAELIRSPFMCFSAQASRVLIDKYLTN